MKRYLGAFAAAGLMFAAVMGSAAALDINDVDPLQVGVTDDGALVCDDDGVNVRVGFEDQEPGDGRSSNSVEVSDIDTACQGAFLVAVALDDDGNELTRGVETITQNTERVDWNEHLDPLDIEGVELHING